MTRPLRPEHRFRPAGRGRLTTLLLCLMLLSGRAAAGEVEFGIDQLLVNNTVTNFGNAFYRSFANLWQPPLGVENFLLVIRERPHKERQSQITLEVDGRILMQFWISWRQRELEELVKQTIRTLRSKMTLEQQGQDEIAQPELSGDGLH